MYRLFLALLVALGIATIWRRRELRNDTDRASKAIMNAASVARSRIAASDDEPVPSDDQRDDATTTPAEVATAG